MAEVSQCLWFEKDMEEAVRFYVETVPGSALGPMTVVPTARGEPEGGTPIVEFTLGGQRYIAMEAGPMDRFNHRFSIMLLCDTQEEIDRLWAALGEGGAYDACGWLRDRWGLSWQITPRMLIEAVKGPDRARARRVAEAMLEMSKLDIATLERAAAG